MEVKKVYTGNKINAYEVVSGKNVYEVIFSPKGISCTCEVLVCGIEYVNILRR